MPCKIYIWFCCALFRFHNMSIPNRFMSFIYPCSSWLLHEHMHIFLLAATKHLYEWFSRSIRSSIGPDVHLSHLFTPQPSGLEWYCRHGSGGWVGGQLPDLRNPYLCNCLMDFLCSKFCGIVQAWICALSWLFPRLPHMDLPMDQNLSNLAQIGPRLCGTQISETVWRI